MAIDFPSAMDCDLAALVKRASRGRDPYADFDYLPQSRADFVRQYRANPAPWPQGPGAWYRSEDWDDDGNLLVTGRAAALALDPWANDRPKGFTTDPLTNTRKPIPALRFAGVDYPDELPADTDPVVQHPATPVVQHPATPVVQHPTGSRAGYQRAYQGDRRSAEKAGLTVAQWRAQQAAPVALIPHGAIVRPPALGAPALQIAA
jgi:hypothetical protein